MELAAQSSNREIESKAIAELVKSPELGARVAATLGDLGRSATAGRVHRALGDFQNAAKEFERASIWLEAAEAHESAGDPRRAASCLETALEVDERNHTARLALGALLDRHGRSEQALRVLQRIPRDAKERSAALPVMKRALLALGMTEGVVALEREMGEAGVSDDAVPTRSSGEAPGGEVLFGRYRTEKQIARTPTARVYRATDLVSGSEVAVKLFSAATLRDAGRDALKRFEREAVVLGKLRHPAIVPLVAFVPEGPAVVLEWMAGGSLADRLASGTLSPARAVEIACAVLSALAEAHRRGILHRDIKPANVLFD